MNNEITEQHVKTIRLKDEDGDIMCITDIDPLNDDDCISISLTQIAYTIDETEELIKHIQIAIDIYKEGAE